MARSLIPVMLLKSCIPLDEVVTSMLAPDLIPAQQQIRCSQMAKSYQQIQAQIVALQKEADVARKREVQNVIRDIKASIALYGLTTEDLGLDGAAKRAASKKTRLSAKKSAAKKKVDGAAEVRFADGTGNAWSGRGPRPGWLKEAIAQGRSVEDLRV